jgi:hypothetical protein
MPNGHRPALGAPRQHARPIPLRGSAWACIGWKLIPRNVLPRRARDNSPPVPMTGLRTDPPGLVAVTAAIARTSRARLLRADQPGALFAGAPILR